jgi:predicted transcriptional regulator
MEEQKARKPFRSRGGEYVGIGSLEARVLRALYAVGDWGSVQQVWCFCQDQKPIARDAVLTCLKRLTAKGFLDSQKDGGGQWCFRPVCSAEEIAREITHTVWEWLTNRPPPEVARFLGDALGGELEGDVRQSTATDADESREGGFVEKVDMRL